MRKLLFIVLLTPLLLAGCLLEYGEYVRIDFVTYDAHQKNLEYQIHSAGSEAKLPGTDDMIQYNHNFIGWSLEKPDNESDWDDEGKKAYKESQEITIDSVFIDNATDNRVTLYAVWEEMDAPSNGGNVFLYYNNQVFIAAEKDGIPETFGNGEGEEVNWSTAMDSHNKPDNGVTWYLPNVEYMRLMVDEFGYDNGNGGLNKGTYWTAESYSKDSDFAWTVDGENGNEYPKSKRNKYNVRYYKIAEATYTDE